VQSASNEVNISNPVLNGGRLSSECNFRPMVGYVGGIPNALNPATLYGRTSTSLIGGHRNALHIDNVAIFDREDWQVPKIIRYFGKSD
jgi:hypothetical protein